MDCGQLYKVLDPGSAGNTARIFRAVHHAMVAAGIGGMVDFLGALPGVLDIVFEPSYASLFGFIWVFKLVRYAPGLTSLRRVISHARHALLSVLLAFGILLLLAASLVYLLERTAQPDVF